MKKNGRRAHRGFALLMVRVGCLALAGISAVGLFVVVPGATAIGATSSSITVGWVPESGTSNGDQPARDAANPEYAAFKNLKVSVAQTEDIGDQAVRVSVSGFAATHGGTDAGGTQYTDAMNFMQAMQCWGPDPLAANFNQTCQWGGRFVDNNGLGNSVYPDNTLRVALRDVAPETKNAVDVPFLPAPAAGNSTLGIVPVTGRQAFKLDANNKPTKTVTYPLLDYTNPATTNEVQSSRVNADGSGVFDFETQSAEQAPQLGCGSAGHLRCWLVLVPRGTKYGGHDDSCSGLVDNAGNAYTFGRAQSIQGGSPINPACSYWNNRMTVPLDFTPVGSTCAADNPQRRVIGSQLLIAAMASWQPALCSKLATTYSFAANPDSVARLQLIENQAGLAFGSFPLQASELDNDADKAKLKATLLSTAPVAIASTVVAYVAEGSDGRLNALNLSPRLMAKLLTQSYEFTVPWNSSEPQKNFAHLPAVNQKYLYFNQDPDFRALNPNWAQFTTNPALMLPGPAGADAIRQLWRWILADTEAKTWISGAPDAWGMTVNPFYLPAGNANAQVPEFLPSGDYKIVGGKQVYRPVGLKHIDGTPENLSETLMDTFPKADESLVPLTLNVEKYRFGTLQYGPYSDSFNNAARSAFRADPNSKTVWDPAKVNAAGDIGDWVSSGAQSPGQKFVIAVTDAASASRYSLNTAALRLDNSTGFATADTNGMTAALSGLTATADPAVKQIDPAQVTGSGYPLTTVVYATVNLSATDKPALTDFAAFIKQVTGIGQVPGTAVGQLPIGYIPLTSAMATQATTAAAAIAAFQPPVDPSVRAPADAAPSTTSGEATTGYAQDDFTPGAAGKDTGTPATLPKASGASGAGGAPVVTLLTADSPQKTPAAPDAFWGQASLALSLGGGLSGAIFAPLLFRGKRFR